MFNRWILQSKIRAWTRFLPSQMKVTFTLFSFGVKFIRLKCAAKNTKPPSLNIKRQRAWYTLCGTTLIAFFKAALLLPISKTVHDNGDIRLYLLARPLSGRCSGMRFVRTRRRLAPLRLCLRRLSWGSAQITFSRHCISINMRRLYHSTKALSRIFLKFFR